MRIEIALRFHPFSHEPGAACLIPGTTWEARIFPALIEFRNLLTNETRRHPISIRGPVKDFTVEQDLEKGAICVHGKAISGFLRYWIHGEAVVLEKNPRIDLIASKERLSLGIHKKQDWDQVRRRNDPAEFLPFWLRLSHLIPHQKIEKEGTYQLLQKIENTSDKTLLAALFKNAFQACFQGILCPRLNDERHLGLIPEESISSCPIGLIHEGARLIRALFFQEVEGVLALLPRLPPEFHSGRLINLTTSNGDTIDLEWSKKELKKAIIRTVKPREIELKLQKGLNAFRLRTTPHQKGHHHRAGMVLPAAQTIYLDRFVH